MALYPSTSKGYLSSARTAVAPTAYYEVKQTDFGALGGAAPALAYNAGAGSLAMSTARAAITWITAAGESLPSAEATVAISAGSGAFTITQPTVPTNGAAVIGWRVYSSSGGAGTALLNTTALSTTQVQSSFVTTQGTLLGFPVATTAVQVLIYGTGQAEPGVGNSGVQTALPSVGANTSVDYFIIVPNAAGQFDTQHQVAVMKPQGIPDGTGLSMNVIGFQAPLYPGTSQSVSLLAYMTMNSYLFICTAAGTTAATFIGGPAFATAKGATTTDGTVTWTCLGKAGLINLRYVNGSGSAAAPAAQEMDFLQI
jgi:hypothetical protein